MPRKTCFWELFHVKHGLALTRDDFAGIMSALGRDVSRETLDRLHLLVDLPN